MKKLICLLIGLASLITSYAYEVIDGVVYNISYNKTMKQYEACLYPNGSAPYGGDFVIPDEISSQSHGKCKVTGIGSCAFSGCTNLTSISGGNNIYTINQSAFANCSNLSSFNINSYLSLVEDFAFKGCSALDSIFIQTPKLGTKVFDGCTLKPLMTNLSDPDKIYYDTFMGLNEESIIVVRKGVANKVAEQSDCNVYVKESKWAVKSQPRLGGFTLTVFDNPYYSLSEEPSQYKLILKYQNNGNIIEKEILDLSQTVFDINDADFASHYQVYVSYAEGNATREYLIHDREVPSPEFDMDVELTQTTLTIKELKLLTPITSEFNPVRMGVTIGVNNVQTIYRCENVNHLPIKVDGLIPEESLIIHPFCVFADGRIIDYVGYKYNTRTKGFSQAVQIQEGPTCLRLTASYTVDDAVPDSVEWILNNNNKEYKGKSVIVNSLVPDNSYSGELEIYYSGKYSSGRYSKEFKYVRTSALELTTLQPKCVSEGCAIIAAETNMWDEETNAGFEWRKFDAPETLPSNKAFAVICDGKLEGFIKNLQPTSYYNVRAFYEDYKGRKYYGDWITFDPSDFSYFEPTVKTYPAYEVNATNATVRGYVLQGSDAILSQGFQYWKSGGNKLASANAPSDSDIITVAASGQVMTSVLDNLTENTKYIYRVFVETSAGFTYGDNMCFTTLNDSGIHIILEEEDYAEPYVIGYYNLSGTKFNEPQPGFNIVLYSNGNSKKIFKR